MSNPQYRAVCRKCNGNTNSKIFENCVTNGHLDCFVKEFKRLGKFDTKKAMIRITSKEINDMIRNGIINKLLVYNVNPSQICDFILTCIEFSSLYEEKDYDLIISLLNTVKKNNKLPISRYKVGLSIRKLIGVVTDHHDNNFFTPLKI